MGWLGVKVQGEERGRKMMMMMMDLAQVLFVLEQRLERVKGIK